MTPKIRVLHLASWFPQGTEDPTGRFIVDQVEALREYCDPRKWEFPLEDVSHRGPGLPPLLRAYFTYLKLLLVQPRPQMIHAHVAFPAGWIAQKLGLHWGVPVVLTEHTGPLELLQPYLGRGESWLRHFQGYDYVIAVSPFLKKDLDGLGCKELSVVGNVVHASFFKRPLLHAMSDFYLACFVGRFTKEKGLDLLLDALTLLDERLEKEEGPQQRILFIGEGEEGQRRIEASSKNWKCLVVAISQGGREAVREGISRSKMLLLPSERETFSLVAAEALALGKPVVATTCGGPDEFLAQAGCPPIHSRDPQLLAQKVYEQMREINHKDGGQYSDVIFTSFSPQSICSQIENIYNKILRVF